jgi:outer membrane protein assembly factor BamB
MIVASVSALLLMVHGKVAFGVQLGPPPQPYGPVGWLQAGFDPAHTGHNPLEQHLGVDNVSRLRLLWKRIGLVPHSAPVQAGGVVYVVTKRKVLALDAATGSTIWSWEGEGADGSPAVANGLVYVPETTGLVALDVVTGSPRWTYSGPRPGAPTTVGRTLYDGFDFAGMFALDALTGKELWRTPVPHSEFVNPVAYANGVAYTTTNTGWVVALDAADGHLLWQLRPGPAFIYSVVPAGRLVYADADRGLFALDGATGIAKWELPGAFGHSPLVFDGHRLITGTDDLRLWAVDAVTGEVEWETPIPGDGIALPRAVANGVVYVATKGSLWAIDATTGQVLRQFGQHVTHDQWTRLIEIDARVISTGYGRGGRIFAYGLGHRLAGPTAESVAD